MPQQIEFDGALHEFPDDFSPAEISTALRAGAAPAAPQAAQPARPDLPEAPPQALIDRFMGGTSVGRVLTQMGKGVAEGWGDSSLGLSDDTITKLQDAHLFANPRTGTPGYLWPIEAPLKVLAPGIEAIGRAFNAGLTGIAEGIGQTAEEVGEDPGMAARLKRDVVEMGNIAALLMGSVNPIRRPVIDATGKAQIEVIGGLPRRSDFDATATAIDALNPNRVAPKLQTLYRDKGLHPAEVYADARRDVTISQDLLADNVEVPRAYRMAGETIAPKEIEEGLVLWHTSPFTFDKFAMDAGNRGAGVGLEGKGLYFGENRRVAETYADFFVGKSGDTPRTYKVVVDAKPDEFLDFEAKLAAQSEKVKTAVGSIFSKDKEALVERAKAAVEKQETMVKGLEEKAKQKGWSQKDTDAALSQPKDWLKELRADMQMAESTDSWSGLTGRELYVALKEKLGGDVEATRALREAGIKGTKFPDKETPGAKSYVLYGDEGINITERYVLGGEKPELSALAAPSQKPAPGAAAGGAGGGKPPSGGGQPPAASAAPGAPAAPTTPAAIAQETVLSKISVGEKSERGFSFDRLYIDTVDDLFKINLDVKKSGLDLPTAENPYRLARLTRGAPAKADMMLTRGTFDWNTYQTNGAALKDIVKPVADDLDGLRAYVASKRAIELDKRSIEPGIDLAAARKVVSAGRAKYGAIQKELVAYQDRVVTYLRDSGVISRDAYIAMKAANREYVPFFRVMDEEGISGSGMKGGVRNPVKTIKGSERVIVDPIESIIKNTYLYTNLAERNAAGRAYIEMANRSGRPADFYEAVPKPVRPTTVAEDEMAAFLKAQGIKDIPDDLLTVFRAHGEPLAKNEIAVFTDGKRQVYRVDPDIADAFKQMDRQSADFLTRMLAQPASLLRAGATITPEFITRNLVRDFFTAFITSKGTFTPIDTLKGVTGVIRKDADWEQWVRGGGAHATMVSMDRNYLQKNIREITGQSGVGAHLWNVVRSPVDVLRVASELAENATRLGEFKKVQAIQGRAGVTGKAASQEAAYAAREVTLDFARMGAKMRAYNMLTAFANAQIQGVDRIARAFKDNPTTTTMRALGGISIPSMLLWWANRDDPRVAEIPQWERDLYWIVPTEDHIYRIPKPFETGAVFGSAVERALEGFVAENPDAYKHMTTSLLDAFTPSVVPTFAVPITEQFANRSTFTGRNLIPADAERLLPEYQYTPYTTELAKKLGELAGAFPGIREGRVDPDVNVANGVARALSTPVLIENYVRAWTGGLGMYALQIADAGLRKADLLPDPPTPAKKLEEIPVVRAFMTRYPSASAQSIQDFHDDYSKDRRYFASWMAKAKEGDVIAMDRIRAIGGERMFFQMDAIKDTLNQHSQMIRMVWKNPDMSPEDKRQIIDSYYYNMIQIGQTGKRALRAIRSQLGELPE